MADDVLGIILARKGSKRLPGKNNARVNGVKLIDVLIKNANNAGISNIWLCTDDPELQDTKGVKLIPRPDKLSGDYVTSEDVIHYILGKHDTTKFKYFCLLQVTAPFFDSESLVHALNMTLEDNLAGYVSVTPAFEPSGNFYIIHIYKFWLNYNKHPDEGLWIPDIHIMMLPWENCIDIDHIHDLRIAQAVYGFERKELPKQTGSKVIDLSRVGSNTRGS
jgi:CMP-N-acetylneuraminic acid synthetase